MATTLVLAVRDSVTTTSPPLDLTTAAPSSTPLVLSQVDGDSSTNAASGAKSPPNNNALIIATSTIGGIVLLSFIAFVVWRVRKGDSIVDVLKLRRRPQERNEEDYYNRPVVSLSNGFDSLDSIKQTRRFSVRSFRFRRSMSIRSTRSNRSGKGRYPPSPRLPLDSPYRQFAESYLVAPPIPKAPEPKQEEIEPVPSLPAWVDTHSGKKLRLFPDSSPKKPEMAQMGPAINTDLPQYGRPVVVSPTKTVARMPATLSGRNSPVTRTSATLTGRSSPTTKPIVTRPPPIQIKTKSDHRSSWATTADAPPTPKFRLERVPSESSDFFAAGRLQMERVDGYSSGTSSPTNRLLTDTPQSAATTLGSSLGKVVRSLSKSRKPKHDVEMALKQKLALRQ